MSIETRSLNKNPCIERAQKHSQWSRFQVSEPTQLNTNPINGNHYNRLQTNQLYNQLPQFNEQEIISYFFTVT